MITLVDTTLRDGAQSPGVSFTLEDKVGIACALADIGIKEIEAGTPIMGKGESEAIREIISLNLPARILTWNRVVEKDIQASRDCGVNSLYVSCPVSDIQIEKKLKKNRAWVRKRFQEIVPWVKREGGYIVCGLEDASRAEINFLLEICLLLEELKVDRIRIGDTVGVLTPLKTFKLITFLRRHVKIPLEIHAHNDFGLATANTLAGIAAGAEYASVTVNGLGERAGNAALAEVVMALEQLGEINTEIETTLLKKLSAMVAKAANRAISPDKPIVGELAFSHESGIHVDGVLKDPINYEPFSPEIVGAKRKILL